MFLWANSQWSNWGFPGGSVVKNPLDKEICIWSLGQEDPLEKEMATHSSILAWEISETKELDMIKQPNNNNKLRRKENNSLSPI